MVPRHTALPGRLRQHHERVASIARYPPREHQPADYLLHFRRGAVLPW